MLIISNWLSLVNIFRLFWFLTLFWIGLGTTPAIAVETDSIPSRIMVTTNNNKSHGSLRSAINLTQVRGAIVGKGINPGQGKSGAIFMVTPAFTSQAHSETARCGTCGLSLCTTRYSDCRGCDRPPLVTSLKSLPEFIDNFATDASASTVDNSDVYGQISLY